MLNNNNNNNIYIYIYIIFYYYVLISLLVTFMCCCFFLKKNGLHTIVLFLANVDSITSYNDIHFIVGCAVHMLCSHGPPMCIAVTVISPGDYVKYVPIIEQN